MRKLLVVGVVLVSAGAFGEGAEWIWFPEGNPAEAAPEGTRYFRKTFEAQEDILGGWLWIAADNAYEVFVNGTSVGTGDAWEKPDVYDVSDAVRTGVNTLAVKATNTGGPAGLLAALHVLPPRGEGAVFFSDGTWKTSDAEQEDWMLPEFDDAAWGEALSMGPPPHEAWPEIDRFGELLSVEVFPQQITPNGDGVGDEAGISFWYPPGNKGGVLIDIVEPTGLPVYSYEGKGETEGTLTWNGRYETGGIVPAGEYRILSLGRAKRHEVTREDKVTVKHVEPWPEAPNVVKDFFPIGLWYDGRVEGINVPEGCTNVPQGLDNAEKYYEETFTDIKNHNIQVVVIPNTPPDYRKTLVSVADRVGVEVVLELAELAWPEFGGRLSIRNANMERDELKIHRELRRITDPIRYHASLRCYQLIDEPPASLFDNWRLMNRILGAVDPEHASFSCLCNEAELPRTSRLGMQMIVFDRYPLTIHTEPGEYDFKQFIALLDTLKTTATDVPYWMVLQAFASPAGARYPTAAELRLMTHLSIAHNAKGVFYFLYNSKTQTERLKGLVDVALNPVPLFEEVGKLAGELKRLSPLLLKLSPIENTIKGEGGDMDIQMAIDNEGVRYAFISNLDVISPVTCLCSTPQKLEGIEDVLTGKAIAVVVADDGADFKVPLERGAGCLLRFK